MVFNIKIFEDFNMKNLRKKSYLSNSYYTRLVSPLNPKGIL